MKANDKAVLGIPADTKDEAIESCDKALQESAKAYLGEKPERAKFASTVGGWNQALNARFTAWLIETPAYKKAAPWQRHLWFYRLAQASNFQKWASLTGGSATIAFE